MACLCCLLICLQSPISADQVAIPACDLKSISDTSPEKVLARKSARATYHDQFLLYSRTLKEAIKSKWQWEKSGKGFHVDIFLRFSGDGHIRCVSIKSSSGSKDFDESVLKAVHAANPFPPIPSKIESLFEEVVLQVDEPSK